MSSGFTTTPILTALKSSGRAIWAPQMPSSFITSVTETYGCSNPTTIPPGERPMFNKERPRSAAIRIGLNDSTFGLLGVAILLFGAVLWSARGPNVEKTDFSLTYVGARIVHQGLGTRLYDLDLQKQVRDSLFQHPNPLFF